MLLRDEEFDEEGSLDRDFVLAQYLPYRFARLSERIASGFHQRVEGVSQSQWRVMANLYQQEPQSAFELCTHSNLDKVQMSRTIARLVEIGWLMKEGDCEDRRRQLLRLSPKGRRFFVQILSKAIDFERDLYATLSAEEHAVLNKVMQKLTARIDKLVK